MAKKNILTIILDSIFVVAFNILFFVNIGSSYTSAIWICYGFLHFAYFMVLLTPAIETKGKTEYLSKLTTYAISLSYFLIELILACAIFFQEVEDNSSLTVASVVSIQTILTAIYLIVLVSNLLANHATAEKEKIHDIENGFIKTVSAKTKYIESITKSDLKKKINSLYCTIHCSPSKTSSEVSAFEESIRNLLDELEKSVEQGDEQKASEQIDEIERLVNKRNFVLKSKR